MGRLKILAPGQTRWLSVHACVRRILQLWEPLKLYFRNLEFEDPTYGNELVFNALQNPLMKIMMMFMEYILGLLTEFNTMFQADAPLFHVLKEETVKLVKILSRNFMTTNYVQKKGMTVDPENSLQYLPLKNIYLGLDAAEEIVKLTTDANASDQPDDQKEKLKTETEKIYLSAREFYKEAIVQLQKRFSFDDDIYEVVSFIEPEKAKSLNPPTLRPYLRRYSLSG